MIRKRLCFWQRSLQKIYTKGGIIKETEMPNFSDNSIAPSREDAYEEKSDTESVQEYIMEMERAEGNEAAQRVLSYVIDRSVDMASQGLRSNFWRRRRRT